MSEPKIKSDIAAGWLIFTLFFRHPMGGLMRINDEKVICFEIVINDEKRSQYILINLINQFNERKREKKEKK